MHTAKLIQKSLIDRISEPEKTEDAGHERMWEETDGRSRHLSQFFKMAEYRKRQILEKMLME